MLPKHFYNFELEDDDNRSCNSEADDTKADNAQGKNIIMWRWNATLMVFFVYFENLEFQL